MKYITISVSHIDETNTYWSDSQLKVKPIQWIDDLETIHEAIARALRKYDYCEMAYKGKPQGNVYRDTEDGDSVISGYHYRTKHYIESRSDNIMKKNVPFTTWVTIHGELSPLELEEFDV